MDNKYYLVRSVDAGVFFGHLKSRNGDEVEMTEARCLWRWSGANDLNQLSAEGITKPLECRFTVSVEEITLLGVCEIIACTDKAVESIQGVPEWRI